MDTEWMIEQLAQFVSDSELRAGDPTFTAMRGPYLMRDHEAAVGSSLVVETILDRATPNWRDVLPDQSETVGERSSNDHRSWGPKREAAQRAIVMLKQREELAARLGDDEPALDAGQLHDWVWGGARSLWASGHFRESVRAASVKINAEAQNKIGNREISEVALFQNAFSDHDPAPGQPRLRLTEDDGGKTARSVRRGIRSFAEGCYAAIRNPASHDPQAELPENEALEQLAAFSVLARWVDRAEIVEHA